MTQSGEAPGAADIPNSVPTEHHEFNVPTDVSKNPIESPGEFKLPEKFQGDEYKGWTESILKSENPDKLEVILDQAWNAQKLIGQKAGLKVPGEGATAEEIKEFRAATGVPEAPDAYKFEPTEWSEEDKEVGEQMTKSRGPEYMAKVAQMFHETGISEKQAKELVQRFDKLVLDEHRSTIEQIHEAQTVADADFTTRATDWYGTRVDSVMAEGKKIVDAALADPKTPENAATLVRGLGTDFILGIAPILDYVNRTYIQEDTSGGQRSLGNGGSQAAPQSESEMRAEAMKLIATTEYGTPGHPGHDAMVAKVDGIYAKISASRSTASKK